jgi:hypothetical protein
LMDDQDLSCARSSSLSSQLKAIKIISQTRNENNPPSEFHLCLQAPITIYSQRFSLSSPLTFPKPGSYTELRITEREDLQGWRVISNGLWKVQREKHCLYMGFRSREM